MRRNTEREMRSTGRRSNLAVLIAMVSALALWGIACSSASREYKFQHPQPGPGVVYVAEQVHGLEDWARGPESRSYARVYSRSGNADEGRLVRITAESVVLTPDKGGRSASGSEVLIDKSDVLFMRVWW
jgi:hypothetical protein